MKRIFNVILALCLITAQTAWAYTQEELSTPLTLEFINSGSVTIANPKSLTMKYSKNGGEKTTAGGSTDDIIITVSAGDKVQLYGNGTTNATYGNDSSGGSTVIFCSAYCYIYGNIMSLVDETGFATNTSLTADKTFTHLFYKNAHLKNHASKELVLPATTLTAYCYKSMFEGCTGLTTAPELPSTTLAANCYRSMFAGCTSLTTAPALPAENLTDYCYASMFSGCTGLTTAPELPATKLEEYCCYSYMFSGCSALTTAPTLPATTLAPFCYESMFNGCTKLNYVKCLATDLTATSCTSNWLISVAETGTFVKAAGASWGNGGSGIPDNWATIDFNSSLSDHTYTIHYDANGGEGTMASQQFTYYEPQKLRANTFTAPEGNFFAGWSTQSDGSGTHYSDQQSIFGLTETNGATITLYAQWVEEKYATPLTLEALNGTVKVTISNQSETKKTIKYLITNLYSASTSTPTLSSFTVDSENSKIITLSSSGDYKLELYGNGTNNTSYEGITISCSADCYIYGNIMSLVDETGFATNVKLTADNTFNGLFSGNTLLTNHGSKPLLLPATTLTTGCYYGMFKGCTGLTTAPALPATSLADACYRFMFSNCSALTEAPELPATTLAANCYVGMFMSSGLTEAPTLPADTLPDACYQSMFSNCRALTEAPELPATTLATYCYEGMFSGCTNLNYVKCLATTNLTANKCTAYWLKGVAQTGTFVKAAGASWGSGESGIPEYWTVYTDVKYTIQFDANGGEGTMDNQEFTYDEAKNLTANSFTAPTGKVFVGWNTKADGSGTHYSDQQNVVALTETNGATITLYAQWREEKYTIPLTLEFPSTGSGGTVTISNPLSLTIKYSINNGEKQTVGGNTDDITINVSEGQTVQLYGTNATYGDEENQTNISCSDECYIYGNIMSLVDETGFAGKTKLTRIYAFSNLFSGNEYLKNHTDATKTLLLPATTLAANCYSYMFSGCSALTTAPELPATTLAANCYKGMFMSSGLTEAPTLPATTLAASCYSYMFSDCSALTEAPELPATTLAANCYEGMFMRSGLTEAPTLPAETLAESCYASMFMSSGLTSAPALPAKTLAANCYESMFQGCADLNAAPTISATTLAEGCYSYMFAESGLTSAPELTVETLAEGCYEFMFSECTSLTSVPTTLPASVLARNCYNNMFYGCSALTEAPALSATTLAESCYNNMFYGCTKLKTAPALSATTLAANCYKGMFQKSGLTEAPTLSAETLAEGCYSYMFLGCTSLASAPALSSQTLAESCYMGMFQGCTALTEAPTLSATTLAANCYNYMFAQSGLTTAPALPAETLAADCYEGMFYGCTNLTTAPELPAKTLVESCYDGMFYGCSNLNYIKMLATKITATACLDNWVDGVAETGRFVKDPRTAISKGISGIPSGWATENTPLYLANNASNSTDINSANGQTCDVVLSDRTLYKDEDWNTLCLPFDLTISGSVLDGADVRTLESSSLSNSTLSMSFSESSLTAIEAGKPYLVKWASGDNIVNPVFSNVTINSTTANVETTNVNFVGSYDPVAFNSADNTVLYLSTGSTLYYPSEAMTFGTCRAHFKLQGDLTAYSANGIKAFKLMNFNGTETGIRSAEENENTTIYDLSGRKVQKMQKGLYIVNGKKILK